MVRSQVFNVKKLSKAEQDHKIPKRGGQPCSARAQRSIAAVSSKIFARRFATLPPSAAVSNYNCRMLNLESTVVKIIRRKSAEATALDQAQKCPQNMHIQYRLYQRIR